MIKIFIEKEIKNKFFRIYRDSSIEFNDCSQIRLNSKYLKILRGKSTNDSVMLFYAKYLINESSHFKCFLFTTTCVSSICSAQNCMSTIEDK